MVRIERDAWILLVALSPQSVSEWVTGKELGLRRSGVPVPLSRLRPGLRVGSRRPAPPRARRRHRGLVVATRCRARRARIGDPRLDVFPRHRLLPGLAEAERAGLCRSFTLTASSKDPPALVKARAISPPDPPPAEALGAETAPPRLGRRRDAVQASACCSGPQTGPSRFPATDSRSLARAGERTWPSRSVLRRRRRSARRRGGSKASAPGGRVEPKLSAHPSDSRAWCLRQTPSSVVGQPGAVRQRSRRFSRRCGRRSVLARGQKAVPSPGTRPLAHWAETDSRSPT
jgi:hypothetical protein